MELDTDCNEWCEEVLELNTFNIPRYYFGDAHSTEMDNIQMHCFSYASKKAYGAVVHFRVALKGGKDCVIKSLKYPITHYFWNDSSITYFWITGAPSRFKPFVKNRIQEIQRFSDPKEWRHCPGKDNPADLIPRGMSAAKLRDSDFWWHGLDWDRVIPSLPFEKLGLDFVGPIITKPNLQRSKVILKSYIEIFLCFNGRAIHFEVVSDLTTKSFLACLRRFIARRLKLSIIWSDNATNFKGAKNIFDSVLKACKSDSVQRFCAKEGIVWNFIPPASPHLGGLWKAEIGNMKRILFKVTKSAVLTFEGLTMLATQIEAVLNSRALCPVFADPADFQYLTPDHFLVEAPLLSIPEPSYSLTNNSLSSRWSLILSLRSKFWERWSQE
ncbi:hypothetical protein HNY73_009764 [Argiope bruennichi]|uniref:Integrase catalytic domain-containing protein n=1 Tax=Argiope bruennichi TaxID=94029 RepID=A0A8T0FAF9_ARGBR|nr:hypothetical protein HNY73_009764 [Argiope bruennichi]